MASPAGQASSAIMGGREKQQNGMERKGPGLLFPSMLLPPLPFISILLEENDSGSWSPELPSIAVDLSEPGVLPRVHVLVKLPPFVDAELLGLSLHIRWPRAASLKESWPALELPSK